MLEIVPYRPSWPHEFAVLATAMRAALGNMAVRIDHIGSTSVPGLAAKDVIDIQITVHDLDVRVTDAMTALGYSLAPGVHSDHLPPGAEGPLEDWQKLYFRAPAGQRRTHTHVRVQGRANQRYALLFRDYLRAHPATAAAYAELKRRLARHLADADDYPDVKDPAVDLIYFAAEAWAKESGWQPGASDA